MRTRRRGARDRGSLRRRAGPLRLGPPSPAALLGESQQWTRVSVTGRYDAQLTFVVRNRSQSTGVGYEVLVPPRHPGGIVFVDRGWVGNAAAANILPTILPPHQVRSPSPDGSAPRSPMSTDRCRRAFRHGRHRDGGSAAQPDGIPAVSRDGRRTAGGDHPADRSRPAEHRPRPAPGLLGAVGAVHRVRLRLRRAGVRNELRAGRAAAEEAGDITPVPARPKKVRIWDEEDE